MDIVLSRGETNTFSLLGGGGGGGGEVTGCMTDFPCQNNPIMANRCPEALQVKFI